MDSPTAIIFSELLPLFGLDATEICALKCTCRHAREAEYIPASKIFIGKHHINHIQNYIVANGDKFIVTSTYMAKVCLRGTLHRLCLEGVKYMLLTIKYGATEHNLRANRSHQTYIRNIIRDAGAKLALPSEWAADDHVVVVNGQFYALKADPFTLAPEYIRDYLNDYIIYVHRHNN